MFFVPCTAGQQKTPIKTGKKGKLCNLILENY